MCRVAVGFLFLRAVGNRDLSAGCIMGKVSNENVSRYSAWQRKWKNLCFVFLWCQVCQGLLCGKLDSFTKLYTSLEDGGLKP